MILKDVLAQRLVAMVKTEEVDFGIGSLNASDSELRFTRLLTDRIVVVFLPGFALERKKIIELRDLDGLPLILMDPDSSVRRLVDRAFESIGRLATPAFEATYMSTAAGMVRAGGCPASVVRLRNRRTDRPPFSPDQTPGTHQANRHN